MFKNHVLEKKAIFVIDNSGLKTQMGIHQSDLNGVYATCLEIRTFTVSITSTKEGIQNVKVISRMKEELEDPYLHFRVHRVQNRFGLIRNNSYFMDAKWEIVSSKGRLQVAQ